jgi:hypothetical protein
MLTFVGLGMAASRSSSWSELLGLRSDSNRRPSDYESKRLRPPGAIQAGSGCSRQPARPASVFLTCRVTAGGMTKGMTRPTHQVHGTMAAFRSRSEGRGSHREAHLPPPWSDGRSGTFRQESVAKASNSQLAQPQATRTAGRSILSRVDQEGRIPDRSHTRGLSGTSRRSTPGLDRRSAAKRSPSSKPR